MKERRSAKGFAAVRTWLSANPTNSQQLLFSAGQAAEYAGEWKEAAGFYRKLLKNPQVNPQLAAQAAPAVYRIMINYLGDAEAAYLFMREDGDRLRSYGRSRQYDAWFLQRAQSGSKQIHRRAQGTVPSRASGARHRPRSLPANVRENSSSQVSSGCLQSFGLKIQRVKSQLCALSSLEISAIGLLNFGEDRGTS